MRTRSSALIGLVLGALALAGCERVETTPPAPPPPPLHETAAASVAELCAEPLRAWAVLGPGGAIVASTRGQCLGRVEHPEQGALWHFVAQLRDREGARSTWELHTWLDDDGRPRFAEFRTPQLVTRFRWDGDTLVVRRLGDELLVGEAGGLWVTPTHAIYLRELMLRLGVGRSPEGLRQRGFVPEHDAVSELPLTLERLDDARAQASAGDTILALDGVAAGLGGLRITAVVAGGAPIYRPLDETELAPFLPGQPRPRYEAPEGLTLEGVEIVGEPGEPTLAGELVYAGEGTSTPGPEPGSLPAVLFIAGAGPQDRHGIVPGSAVDIGSHELHDALALAGFAVLRVDDRGVGQSGIGDDPTPGFTALVDDARRALAALASHALVDPSKIIVIGHGEGALVASILAAERVRARKKHRVAGLVLLAGPGRNLRELVYDEIRASLVGHGEGELRTVVDRARRVHDAALAGEELPASSEGARQWMVEAFAEDPLARLARVRAPILALQGAKDFQVSPERDFGPIRELVETRAAEGSAAELLPELDHLFKHEPGLSRPGHYADLRRQVDPAVIERVTSWARSVVD